MAKQPVRTPGDTPTPPQAEDMQDEAPAPSVQRMIDDAVAAALAAQEAKHKAELAAVAAASIGARESIADLGAADGMPDFMLMHSAQAKAWFDAHPKAQKRAVQCIDGWYVPPDAYRGPRVQA
jgi:hypothetical protein